MLAPTTLDAEYTHPLLVVLTAALAALLYCATSTVAVPPRPIETGLLDVARPTLAPPIADAECAAPLVLRAAAGCCLGGPVCVTEVSRRPPLFLVTERPQVFQRRQPTLKEPFC